MNSDIGLAKGSKRSLKKMMKVYMRPIGAGKTELFILKIMLYLSEPILK